MYNLYLRSGSGSYVTKQHYNTLKILQNDLNSIESADIYVGGDFNFVTNKLDTSNPASLLSKKLPKDIELWEVIKDIFRLKDLFRKQFKTEKVFTKFTTVRRKRVARRIDQFYGSQRVIDYRHIPFKFL